MSLVVRKPAFCICENKDADQLRSYCAADQRYTDSTIPLHFEPLAIFFGCTARFVSHQVGNPEDWFSNNEVHIIFNVAITTAAANQNTFCLIVAFSVGLIFYGTIGRETHRIIYQSSKRCCVYYSRNDQTYTHQFKSS